MDKAVNFFNDMQAKNIKPDTHAYTIIIDNYRRLEQMEDALNFYELMLKNEFKPNNYTYASLITGLGVDYKIDKAEALLNEMITSTKREDLGEGPFNAMMSNYCARNLPEKAVEIFQKMKNNWVIPDVYTYNILIAGFIGIRDKRNATIYVSELKRSNLTATSKSLSLMREVHNMIHNPIIYSQRLQKKYE